MNNDIIELKSIIKEIIDYRGKTPKKLGSDWSNCGYRALSAKNIKTGKIVQEETIRYVDDDLYKKWMKQEVERGTILITSEAPFGEVLYWDSDEKIVLSQRIFGLKIDEKYNSEYIYYYMTSREFKGELEARATGSTVTGLRQPELLKCKIKVPNKDIQDKIAFILKCIDRKIELNNQINDNLHELAQVLFEEDLNKENLENYKLEDLFYQIAPGTNYQPKRVEDGIPFLNVKNINSGYIDFSDSKYISEEDYAKVHKTWQPEENDLLISRIGTLGLVAVIRKEDLPLAVHYNFLNLKTNKIPFEFGYFMLKSQYFQTKYKLNIKNSVQEYVTVDDIRKIEVDIPQLNDMEKYKVLYNKILNIQRENRFLTQLRDTLLPKLMNGEIDLDKIEI